MTSESILGHSVTLELLLADAAAQRALLTAKFAEMAGVINASSGDWSAEQAQVFRLTNQLTIFREVTYQGRHMTRSFMAQKERIFYWTIDEFLKWEPAARRPTAYFHDAWHVHQYLTNGPAPNKQKVLIDREQEAMAEQLKVARVLRCDQGMIDWLTAYANDRERIKERLGSGVGMNALTDGPATIEEHFLILD